MLDPSPSERVLADDVELVAEDSVASDDGVPDSDGVPLLVDESDDGG
jgi:hypothetical protein